MPEPDRRATVVGRVVEARPGRPTRPWRAARAGFRGWAETPGERAPRRSSRPPTSWRRGAARLIALLQAEAGKTLDDARLRGARGGRFLPLLRGAGARRLFGDGEALPGPTGEENVLRLRGRGVFVVHPPWNFPLAIFLGQVAAALVAGNAVVAKPAEQTPLVAAQAVRILHEAGVPTRRAASRARRRHASARALVAHPRRRRRRLHRLDRGRAAINRALAAKDGPIVPLIAETGGINAMIVDATALPEQVADDVVDVGLPLRRPALLGAAPALRAGGRRRPDDRDDRGRRRAS